MRLIQIALFAAFVAACSPSKFVERFLTPEEQQLVRSAVNDVSRSDSADLAKKVPPELAGKVAEAMPFMHLALPPQPFELSATNVNFNTTGGVRVVNAVYQAKGKDARAVVQLTMQTSAGHTLLTAIHVERTPG
jgi:hypothetical protein